MYHKNSESKNFNSLLDIKVVEEMASKRVSANVLGKPDIHIYGIRDDGEITASSNIHNYLPVLNP